MTLNHANYRQNSKTVLIVGFQTKLTFWLIWLLSWLI